MKYRIQMSEKALADVEAVLVWFKGQFATAAGQRWLIALWNALDTLESRPERCALAAEAEALGREIRELMFGKKLGRYRIFFQIHRQTVLILRIWHSARDEIRADDL